MNRQPMTNVQVDRYLARKQMDRVPSWVFDSEFQIISRDLGNVAATGYQLISLYV